MDRFSILKGLSPPKRKETWCCPECNYAIIFERDSESTYCSNCGIELKKNLLRKRKIDIEILGEEYQGYLNKYDLERAEIFFWVNSNQVHLFKNLDDMEIHFHYRSNVYYLLIQGILYEKTLTPLQQSPGHSEAPSPSENQQKSSQIKIIISGSLH
jgi:hypothetical protein